MPEASSKFDVERFRAARARWKPVVESVLGPATELMLDMTQLSTGTRILDIGAGAGGQTLLAAARVGPQGRVVATDVALDLLEIAGSDARALGLTNVECRVMNAEQLEFEDCSFDAAISRNVLMYIPDISRALSRVHRVLRPGGRLSSVVWSARERNAFLSIFESTMAEHLHAAGIDVALPDPFRFGQSESLRAGLIAASFGDVQTKTVEASWCLPSADVALEFLKGNPSYLLRILEDLADVDRAEVWGEIRQKLEQFDSPAGFVGPGELLVVAARKC